MLTKMSLTALAIAAIACGQTSTTGSTSTPATRAQLHVNRLAAQLTLTDAQKASALPIFTTAYTNAQTPQTNLQTARTALRDAVKANNSAVIDQQSAAVGTATTQLTSIHAKAEAAFYALLTADQKTLYDAARGRGMGGRGGMGGSGGAGPRGRRG
jgi:Spy/CpxP family protein refolding chaperone